jgi:hypothetical protein
VSAPGATAEVFAGAAYDPAATDGGLLAWQRPSGVALLARDGGAVGLPGRNPAVAPGLVAWRDGERLWVADAASLQPLAGYDAPGAGVFALSSGWIAWRTRSGAGADQLWARRADASARPERVAATRPPAELGRPALAGGDLLLYHQAGPGGSRLVALDLTSGRRRVLRREPGAMLTNPSTDGRRLLYVRATGRTQELRIGPLRSRETARDRIVLVTASPGQRDDEVEPGRTRHNETPLPPRAWPGIGETLWSTALTATHAYVTRLRTARDAPRTADILRVPLTV